MLDKAIKYGKEKRKPYRHSKAFDRSCRNHGSCSYCADNRQITTIRAGKDTKVIQEGILEYYGNNSYV